MDARIGAVLRGRKLKKILRTQYSDLRKKYDITQLDIELLQYFSENPGAAASDVIRDLDLNKGNVSTALFKLFRNGLVDGEPNDHDRRIIEYRLREKGKKIIRETDGIQEKLLEQVFRGVTEQEKDIMKQIADKVCRNLMELEG